MNPNTDLAEKEIITAAGGLTPEEKMDESDKKLAEVQKHEYDKKLAEMQKYVPFLEAMIERLQKVKDKSRETQLEKMQSLHGILTNNMRKLRIETLLRCEGVLQKLYNKVEKGNAPGANTTNKKTEEVETAPKPSGPKPSRFYCPLPVSIMDETPASPSPPRSPDRVVSHLIPIIIPTERKNEYNANKSSSKPASPGQCETISTTAPIVIPMERREDYRENDQCSSKNDSNNCRLDIGFSEWDMLEEFETQNADRHIRSSWPLATTVATGNDVINAAKLVGNSLPQKHGPENRCHTTIASRHIQTVPVPSLGGSRRLSSVLEKSRFTGLNLEVETLDSKPDSPVNVQDSRLLSPDPDILFPRSRNPSPPRLKEISIPSKMSSKPTNLLLASPLPVLTQPPLTMEDIAELLNEDNDNDIAGDKTDKPNDQCKEKLVDPRKAARERLSGDAGKGKKEQSLSAKQQPNTSIIGKDLKVPKNVLSSQEDIDKESEKRWERIDKHIVKMTGTKRSLPGTVSTFTMSAKIDVHISTGENTTDNRDAEPRYADNYERHPRQNRDYDGIRNKISDELSNMIQSNLNTHGDISAVEDDRNNSLYQRRPQANMPSNATELIRDNADYFGRQMGCTTAVVPIAHQSLGVGEYCNPQQQWSSSQVSYPINVVSSQTSVPYVMQPNLHPDMWTMTPATNLVPIEGTPIPMPIEPPHPIAMDPPLPPPPLSQAPLPHHMNEPQIRPNSQFAQPIRPLISPTSRPQDANFGSGVEPGVNIPGGNVPQHQPLVSPTNYPVDFQYHGFQPESTTYEGQSFERPGEFAVGLQTWDTSTTSRASGEAPDGRTAVPNSFGRPGTPCPWGRSSGQIGRGRELYYGNEQRTTFNREIRRDRTISERDPRCRPSSNQTKESSATNTVPMFTTNIATNSNNISTANITTTIAATTTTAMGRNTKSKEVIKETTKSTSSKSREKDPRRRTSDVKTSSHTSNRKSKQIKSTSSVRKVSSRRGNERDFKASANESNKDQMQSPLESLYGVIDTRAKTGKGYGLQKFKIPKIKRPEPEPVTSTTSNLAWDEEYFASNISSEDHAFSRRFDSPPTSIGNLSIKEAEEGKTKSGKDKLDKTANPENSDKKQQEVDIIVDTVMKNAVTRESDQNTSKESSCLKFKEEVTQEWIEALIRKSFEHGEGKKLFEQAKLLQKLGEALQEKKLKKIKRIIQSESESSSSECDEISLSKMTRTRKTRRVIVSDSSDDECLADRLGMLEMVKTTEKEPQSTDHDKQVEESNAEEEIGTDADPNSFTMRSEENEKVSETQDAGVKQKKTKKKREKSTKKGVEAENNKNKETPEKESGEAIKTGEEAKTGEETTDGEKAKAGKETTVGEEKENVTTKSATVTKVKQKRRNSLEMLQEDIREMFISQGVITATGHRMCRLIKRGQSSLNNTVQSLPGIDTSMEINEPSKSKSKILRKKRAARVQSKEVGTDTSDSERDQPLALRIEHRINTDGSSREKFRESTGQIDQDASFQDMTEEAMMLRRSQRMTRAVTEKSDLPKIDSSKIMFDSSSDESFGIDFDVSELTAAVDISLHPELQTESEIAGLTGDAKPSSSSPSPSGRKSVIRRKAAGLREDRADVTDEGSVVSDVSMSSSTISAKKAMKAKSSTLGTNEELLSDMLVGLVSRSSGSEKRDIVQDDDTVSDMGAAGDDSNEAIPMGEMIKKLPPKKKKNKWQMGILSKKKRTKKKNSWNALRACSTPVPETNRPLSRGASDKVQQRDDNIDSVINEVSTMESWERTTTETTVSKRRIQVFENSRHTKATGEESRSDCERSENAESTNEFERGKESTNEVTTEKGQNRIEEMAENMEEKELAKLEEVKKMDVGQLLEYYWNGNERLKCLLCVFVGKNIVHHYKQHHSKREVLISRLSPSDAELVKKEVERVAAENRSITSLDRDNCRFKCRCCSFEAVGPFVDAFDNFYEHCTAHTGEYRYQCLKCPYQSVRLNSVKTHYYKVCRKYAESISVAFEEDKLPQESNVYAYLCTTCNFFQLKKDNVEKHVLEWHNGGLDTRILRFNMSNDAKDRVGEEAIREEPDMIPPKKEPNDPIEPETRQGEEDLIIENTLTKLEKEMNESFESETKVDIEDVEQIKSSDSLLSLKDEIPHCSKHQENIKVKEEERPVLDTPKQEPEMHTVAGNLSVFVCPPELENKEEEIQMERKKRMQEIADNIGINLNKDASKRSLSIIDKLKDKMETTVRPKDEASDKDPLECSETSTSSLRLKRSSSQSSLDVDLSACVPPQTSSEIVAPVASNSLLDTEINCSAEAPSESSLTATSESASNPENKADIKLRDPLKAVDNPSESYGTDTSDNETVDSAVVPAYESDTSEQSDNEIGTDVNTLLKETTNIDSPSTDLMMTTIQRLAAQLSGANKPLPLSTVETPKLVTTEAQCGQSNKIIPEAPPVIPISSIRRFIRRKDVAQQEVVQDAPNENVQPKNFIRPRRLSGDMLSVTGPPAEAREDTPSLNVDGSPSNTTTEVLKTNTKEECSFLKIESVISLASSSAESTPENAITNDIRIINCGASVLKKSSPIILKRVLKPKPSAPTTIADTHGIKFIPIKSKPPIPVSPPVSICKPPPSQFIPIAIKPNILPINTDPQKSSFPLPTSSTIQTVKPATRTISIVKSPTSVPKNMQNYKIVKVLRTPKLLKHKEHPGQSIAIKQKSSEAYNAMLTADKLCNLYKCMERDCSFTTDAFEAFRCHFHEHANEVVQKKLPPPYTHQNCAYCSLAFEDWVQMNQHLQEKHNYCKYQCSYCFYRAITQSYVEVHQAMNHPGKPVAVMLCSMAIEKPAVESVDRSECIQPFICQHECGKFFYVPEAFITHLCAKHGRVLSIFKCHMCSATSLKPEQLVAHYKMHGLYKYQCLYCVNGSDTVCELHNHLSNFHSNRPPIVLERTLPPDPNKNKDVVEQLLIRNVDEGYKCSELINASEASEKNRNPPSSPKKTNINIVNTFGIFSGMEEQAEAKNKESKEVDETTNNLSGIASSEGLPQVDDSKKSSDAEAEKSPSMESIKSLQSNPSKYSESTVGDSMNKSNEAADVESCDPRNLIHEPELLLRYRSEDAKSAVDNAVDPLELTDANNCNDEFISSNFFDNPDFLKSLEDRSNSTTATQGSSGFTKEPKEQLSCDKNDDSDIEILEDTRNSSDVTIKEVKPSIEKLSRRKQDLEIRSDKIKNESLEIARADMKTPSILCSSAEDSNTSYEMSTSEQNSPTKYDESSSDPITLDDIKNTGFTGEDLYKCGNDFCAFRGATADLLKSHLKECQMTNCFKSLVCAHCSKRFQKVGFLLEHLRVHGLKRFGCSICKMRFVLAHQATSHMKTRHKLNCGKLVPADPKNPSADGLFVIQPTRPNVERIKSKKRGNSKSAEKESIKPEKDSEKTSFAPEEVEDLPRQAIYNREVQCAICPYTTKVRTNMIRHLQLHTKDESVPESGPVNPVPCLDKREKMFDKMVNLASSSHQNGRMGKPKDTNTNDDESMPKFVPEHKRYVCGVAECSYLTVDEAMLRYHLKALHSEEPYFRCHHCPPPPPGQESQNIAIDKMGIHLKMHDTRLYKCSHCNHHHYHRHFVERHLADKHPEKRPYVKVIRELESTECAQQTTQEEPVEDDISDPDGNHWKCNVCDYKCVYKAEMITHASTVHDEKCQYKCDLCPYKTGGKVTFKQHAIAKHPNELDAIYTMVYQKIKGTVRKSIEATEQGALDEPFDTTPLWRRDMPRVRHIRGILLEDEDDASTSESPTKFGKRKDNVDASPKPAKIKLGKSVSLDGIKDEKPKVTSSRVEEMRKSTESITKEMGETTANAEKSAQSLDSGRFGPYGKPNGNMYVCTLCTSFKSKYKHDMRDHLFRELKYTRWHCKSCDYMSVNRNGLLKHFHRNHPDQQPNHEPLSPNNAIEEWVGEVLKRQTEIMKKSSTKVSKTSSNDNESSTKTSLDPKSEKKTPSAVQLPKQSLSRPDNADIITSLRKDQLDQDLYSDDDDDSLDGDNLIIDISDEEEMDNDKKELEKPQNKPEEEKLLVCKHCSQKFARWRGFKLHVQVTHLKRLGFLCPYCDRSTNSESMMRQHIHAKHPGQPERVIQNPSAGGPELTNEFWEKEYGLIIPKKKKKRKRKLSKDENISKQVKMSDPSEYICKECTFTTMNYSELASHMRIHSLNCLKCGYCNYVGLTLSEIWNHSSTAHVNQPLKVDQESFSGPLSPPPPISQKTDAQQQQESRQQKQPELQKQNKQEPQEQQQKKQEPKQQQIEQESKRQMQSGPQQQKQQEPQQQLQSKKRAAEDYDEDVVEDDEVTAFETPQQRQERSMYCCFYCNLRSPLLETIKTHWSMKHKDPKSFADSAVWKSGLPFRFKEIHTPIPPPVKSFRCYYCPKIGSVATLRIHIQRKHGNVPIRFADATVPIPDIGWICQWCNELCDTEEKMNHHHNMFHSHLPSHFKKQEGTESMKGYVCPKCPFNTVFVGIMKKHVAKHINMYECTYCRKRFVNPSEASKHSTQNHVGQELKMKLIGNHDTLVDELMARVTWSSTESLHSVKTEFESDSAIMPSPKKLAVAKKSTAKSTVGQQPSPSKIKAVARKSTNPLPRYPPGMKFDVEKESAGVSYYGRPRIPVNLDRLNTSMMLSGGHRMNVKCSTLAQFMNIDPEVVVKDLKFNDYDDA